MSYRAQSIQVAVEVLEGILLPQGEGGAERRMRESGLAAIDPLTRRPSRDGRHPLPDGRGI